MKTPHLVPTGFAAVLTGAALGLAATPCPGQAPPPAGGKVAQKKPPAATPAPEPFPDALHLKTFRLRHQEPANLVQVAAQLFGLEVMPRAHPAPKGALPGVGFTGFPNMPQPGAGFGGLGGGGLGGFPGGGLPGAGFMGGGFAGAGFMGGGLMGAGFVGQPPSQGRIAADPRTRTLLVRASAEKVHRVSDLVSVLDVPPGKPRPKVKDLRVFDLRFADAKHVHDLIAWLGLGTPTPMEGGPTAAVANASTIVVAGPEELFAEIGELIEALDIPADKEKTDVPKTRKTRKK